MSRAPAPGRYRIGIDVGGTFTDVVAVDDAGNTQLLKVPSTPEDQSEGVMRGLALLAERLGMPLSQLLAHTVRMVHGMTVATNALLENKGASVGLLTTEGHRDVLEKIAKRTIPERFLRCPVLCQGTILFFSLGNWPRVLSASYVHDSVSPCRYSMTR